MSHLHSGPNTSSLFERLRHKTTELSRAFLPPLERACRALSGRVGAAWSTIRRKS
jgi:hypothetical protein